MKFGSIVISVGLILLLAIISLVVALGLAVGVGWLLTLLLPFTLFEASLLMLVSFIIVGTFWRNILKTMPEFEVAEDEEDYYSDIPASQFYKSNKDKTWEAWTQYQIANDIYTGFQEEPDIFDSTGEEQLQDMAIKLAEIAIPLFKTKSGRARRPKVTAAALKRQMNKIRQQPYDDEIMNLAATAINDSLDYIYNNISFVSRSNLWDVRCDLFDLE